MISLMYHFETLMTGILLVLIFSVLLLNRKMEV